MKVSAFSPLRWRNFGLMALVAGVLLGVWLSNFFRGFGLGPETSNSKSTSGAPAETAAQIQTPERDRDADIVGHHDNEDAAASTEGQVGGLVKVVIDDRRYFIRQDNLRQPIGLAELIDLIDRTVPNEDGRKAIIDRTANSRADAEIQLFEALRAAGVPDNAIYLSPRAVE